MIVSLVRLGFVSWGTKESMYLKPVCVFLILRDQRCGVFDRFMRLFTDIQYVSVLDRFTENISSTLTLVYPPCF